ncbi:MAG TPA: hypothetical protein VND65_19710 [Candidatus Binatia bacterium]|nr:hypothetical protein [Candidatus Binatia bacterium]
MTIAKHAALLLMMLVGLTGLLNAQNSAGLKAQVPFAFAASGQTMPAGECTIAVVTNGRTYLSITSGGQHVFALPVGDLSPGMRQDAALVFHQYGDRYFLTGIKGAGGIGYQLPASKLEQELRAGNAVEKVFTLLASVK